MERYNHPFRNVCPIMDECLEECIYIYIYIYICMYMWCIYIHIVFIGMYVYTLKGHCWRQEDNMYVCVEMDTMNKYIVSYT